jgi:hypothetical protein
MAMSSLSSRSSGPGAAKRSPELLMSMVLPSRVSTCPQRCETQWTSRARGSRTLARRSGPEKFGSRTSRSMTPIVGGARAFGTVLLVVVRYGRLAGTNDAAAQTPGQIHRSDVAPEDRAIARRRRLAIRIKLDGFRAIAFRTGGKVHLWSRNDKDFTAKYPAIVQPLAPMPDETVIDGENVSLEAGRPSFSDLQNHGSSIGPIFYYVFEVMVVDGKDVMAQPLEARREVLLHRVLSRLADPIRESIRSFFRYASLEAPAHSGIVQRVLAIPNQRQRRALVGFLSRPEIEALLTASNRTKWLGCRDHDFLLTAVHTGPAIVRDDLVAARGCLARNRRTCALPGQRAEGTLHTLGQAHGRGKVGSASKAEKTPRRCIPAPEADL